VLLINKSERISRFFSLPYRSDSIKGTAMAATIKQVAKHARVSTSTVSHVLNGTHYVSPELTTQVLQAVDELGFQLNRVARSLAQGQVDIFALVVRDIANPFFAELAHAVQQAAQRHGYDVLLYNTGTPAGDNLSHEANFLTTVNKWPIAGLIICQDSPFNATELDRLRATVPDKPDSLRTH
jgi:DNA-binding LacI/PurR family transcriptional regulator